MDFTKQILENRRALIEDLFRRVEIALQPFAYELDCFLEELFRSILPRNWRQQWHDFVIQQETKGVLVDPSSVVELEEWIEVWAKYCELLPLSETQLVSLVSNQRVTAEAFLAQPSSPQKRFGHPLPYTQNDYNRRAPGRRVRPTQLVDDQVARAKACLDQMNRLLSSLGAKLDAAKVNEIVDVDSEVDAVAEQIWLFNDAIESALDSWILDDLPLDVLNRIYELPVPNSIRLPRFVDAEQEERERRQRLEVIKHCENRSYRLNRNVYIAQKVEQVTFWVGLGGGLIASAARVGGRWAVVKVLAAGVAAAGADYLAERALRAACANEQAIRGARLAAAVVTLVILRRNRLRTLSESKPVSVRKTDDGVNFEPSVEPPPSGPYGPNPPGRIVRPGPRTNPSGNLDGAARAARAQPYGPKVPAGPKPRKYIPPIEGRIDKPRSPHHTFLQTVIAEDMQNSGYYQRISMRMKLSRFTGIKVDPDIEPDNMGLTWTGRVDMIEVLSPGQKRTELEEKLIKAMNQLPPEMRGEWLVIDPKDAFK